MYFFTADEHYGHANIIKHCNRPFDSVKEMDAELIRRHNIAVTDGDFVVHVGDFCFRNKRSAQYYIEQLNGKHIFVLGSHDKWMPKTTPQILQLKIDEQLVVACHYAMRTWPKSHYGSWQVYGHSHGKLPPQVRQWDVGVDNNDFYPVSFRVLESLIKNATNAD